MACEGAQFGFLEEHSKSSLGGKAISYAVGFRQSKTALFDWTFFRLGFFLRSVESIL